MDLRESLQGRLSAIQTQRQRLVQQWAPYINAVGRYVKENQGRDLSVYDKHNMAVCLENATMQAALMGKSKLFEATTETDVAFLGISRLCAA